MSRKDKIDVLKHDKINYDVDIFTNCPDGRFHEWLFEHSSIKCSLCNTKYSDLINEQNRKLVDRLCNVRSCYSHKDWENDYQKHKKIIKNMSLYPEQYTIDYSTS
jgi:hypothetical protein